MASEACFGDDANGIAGDAHVALPTVAEDISAHQGQVEPDTRENSNMRQGPFGPKSPMISSLLPDLPQSQINEPQPSTPILISAP